MCQAQGQDAQVLGQKGFNFFAHLPHRLSEDFVTAQLARLWMRPKKAGAPPPGEETHDRFNILQGSTPACPSSG